MTREKYASSLSKGELKVWAIAMSGESLPPHGEARLQGRLDRRVIYNMHTDTGSESGGSKGAT